MLFCLFFLFFQTSHLHFASAQFHCINNGNYTRNSTYSNNLDAVLSSVQTNIGPTGFYNATAGSRDPDRAHVIALCRADLQVSDCRDCIQGIATSLRSSCPNQRQAIQWEPTCMLRYSNETMIGIMTDTPRYYLYNTQNASDPIVFMSNLSSLVDSLRVRAANGGPQRKMAFGNVTINAFQSLYAMPHCTPDLSADQCDDCLRRAASAIPSCCSGSIGARILLPSCNLRYEVSNFYNETRLLELQPRPSPPPAPQPPVVTPPIPPPASSGNSTTRTIIIVVVSIVVSMVSAAFIWILLRRRIKRKPKTPHYETIDDMSMAESLNFELRTLRVATNDFSENNKLGQGGFGAVYKGTLSNDQEIAVKRLSQNSGQGDQEFTNEVVVLAKLQHRNLVRLLGFCIQGMEKLLIYEFVENSSLDHFIFDPIKRSYLDWEKRYKIICGIARGILYLHEDSQVRIIHRDLKPSNVLLDGAMNPKIADFGMARLFGQEETQGNTSKVVGTYGYMPPEYAMHGQFSIKSDVFSFGVLVLEIISGRKNNCVNGETIDDLLTFAWKHWSEGTAANILDPCLKSGSGSISDILRCIHIGLLCAQENASDRPTMASVVLMLSSDTLTMAVPGEPAFFIPSIYGSDTSLLQKDTGDSGYKNSSNSSLPTQSDVSRNEMSISDFYPR